MVRSVPSLIPAKASPVPPWAAAPGPSTPLTATRRQHIADFAALLGREYFGGVGHGLYDPPAERIMYRDLVGPELFDSRPVNRLLRQKIPCGRTGGQQFFPRRQQILHRAAHDRPELLLLLGGGVDLDRHMPDHAVRPGFDDRLDRAVEETASPIIRKRAIERCGGG